MSFFLRKVRGTAWDGETLVDDTWRAQAHKDFTLRVDEESWSLFEANTSEERLLVAAAFTLRSREKRPVDLLEIPEEVLAQYGSIDRDGQGDTPLPAANKLHVSLHTDNGRLAQLADALRARGAKATRYAWGDSILPTLRGVDPTTLEGESAAESAEWLKSVKG